MSGLRLYDVLVTLDMQENIRNVTWEHTYLQEVCGETWNTYLQRNFFKTFGIPRESRSGTLHWKEEAFSYVRLPNLGERALVLMKREDDRRYLLERTLDKISEGIQVYDKNACLVYLNSTSREISNIPNNLEVEGKHLLDLYELDETVSTVLTSLRTGSPVINRFDDFNSTIGSQIVSANTAYPIFKNNEIAGSIVFEQSIDVVNARIAQLEATKVVMQRESAATPAAKFTGYTFDDVIGSGKALRDAVVLAKRVARQDCSVLLVGETGTGKEIFAQSIHKASRRKNGRFIAINCAAVPEALIEGLFFGTCKGSFTGSVDKPGYVEDADGGTLFLDELNSMSLSMQSKILRVIQEGVFRRVGGSSDIHTDIRIISSCNEDPFQLITGNTLRKDLFYRLSTVTINLPPLREHLEDLELLVHSYISRQAQRYLKPIPTFSQEVMDCFARYDWPGNVRELFHVLDHILNVVDSAPIEPAHLPAHLQRTIYQPAPAQDLSPKENWLHSDLQHIMDTYESQVIRTVLEHCGHNVSKAAESLGLRRQSLQYRIKKYGIVL